ncbi:EpsG family protein [Flavobacterium undicola]|uniref:EpsG family protein n=1 Tax=Flavobacterium undicola TaxID=1932779 RepID=UPI00137811CA|nr:EpsG family protein [Flavobacterium undicola]MBA0884376.1 EpsG family protein [Flavobacterium undicola]
MYYFLFFIVLCAACLVSIAVDGKEYSKYIYIFLFFLFWFTAGLRYETGIDYYAYKDIYLDTYTFKDAIINEKISEVVAEPGYLLLNSLFRSFGTEINIMFFFISLVTSFLLFNSFQKYLSKYKFIALLIYFSFVYFTLDMSGIRQAIAVNIFLYSFRFILERKMIKYFFMVILASFFHASALIGLVLYWLFNKKISSSFIVVLTLFGLIVISMKISIINIIVDDVLTKIMPATAMFKLFYYSTSDNIWGLNIKVFFNIIVLFILVYNRKILADRFVYFNLILNSLFFYVFCREILWESININSRINFYFIFGLVMGIPLLLDLVQKKHSKIGVFVFVIAINFYQCSEFFFIRSAVNPYQNYFIYKTFNLKSTGQERFKEEANKQL